MDIAYFLRKRTKFIRSLYDDSARPFEERMKLIEDGKEPYEMPGGYEDDEPPFLDEWAEADEALDVLGQLCISLLAASLKLYLTKFVTERRFAKPTEPETLWKQGWVNGYWQWSAEQGLDWSKGPTDLALLEELALTRNRVEHPEDIWTFRVTQSEKDAAKYPHSYFADDPPMRLGTSGPARVHVTRKKLSDAVEEVEAFCTWLDKQ